MFSSRTLTDRNNDPKPYVCLTCNKTRCASFVPMDGHTVEFRPRGGWQYGTLPENPILVEWRDAQILSGDSRRIERELRWMEDRQIWRDATDEQFAHAKRVLSLLAAVTR